MTNHQRRLLRDMIVAVDDFRSGSIDLVTLVGKLEGALQAGEFQDREFMREWYERWGPLEEIAATLGDKAAPRSPLATYVAAMRELLVTTVDVPD